jgi:hypothetical protein
MEPSQHQFATVGVRDALAARFGLPNGPNMQDWEYEVADPARTEEFLCALEQEEFRDDERFIFSETVMQCFEELAGLGLDLAASEQWRRFVRLLRLRPKLHATTLFYWADVETMPQDSWHVAPFVRELWKELEPTIGEAG